MKVNILLLCALLLCSAQLRSAEPPALAELRSKVEKASQVSAHGVLQSTEELGDRKVVTDIEFWTSPEGYLIIEKRPEMQWAYGSNKSYTFMLRRENESEDWSIAKMPSHEDMQRYVGVLRSFMLQSTSIDLQPLLDVLPSDEHQVQIARSEDGLIRLSFTKPQPTRLPRHVSDGVVMLDPDAGFAVRNFTCNVLSPSDTATSKGDCTYSEEQNHSFRANEQPNPKRRVVIVKPTGGGKPVNIISEFSMYERMSIPRDRYQLSSFGFPEPQAYNPRAGLRTRTVLLVVCAIIAIAVGATFVSKRKSTV